MAVVSFNLGREVEDKKEISDSRLIPFFPLETGRYCSERFM